MITLNKDDLTEGFEIEPNTLINDDCLNAMKFIPDNSISMILTDPPYGTTACKWDSIIPLEPMWEQLKRIIKPNGSIIMTASQPFTSVLVLSNLKMFKYNLVWEKSRSSSPMLAKKQPMRFHEDICVFYSKQPTYNPAMTYGEKNHGTKDGKAVINIHGGIKSEFKANTSNLKYPRSVIKIKSTDSTRNLHPTQKPVALMEYLIKTYTNENETVLDFTMGSGTTGVAAKNLNRSFIGIEMDEGYFNVAKERIGV